MQYPNVESMYFDRLICNISISDAPVDRNSLINPNHQLSSPNTEYLINRTEGTVDFPFMV